MSISEVMTIMALIQLSGVRCSKWFYNNYVAKDLSNEFLKLVSYNRFVELQKKAVLPMTVFAKTFYTGVSFVYSAPLRVCNNICILNYKPFDRMATCGKSTMAYFYDFKLHIVVKHIGQIIDF